MVPVSSRAWFAFLFVGYFRTNSRMSEAAPSKSFTISA